MEKLEANEFLQRMKGATVVDVRSPAEFRAGHIPGAVNIPLFEDDERAIIGTIYKQKGRDPAIETGLEMVGPKMSRYIRELNKITVDNKTVLVHCWRGGMRSESMGWLFEKGGYEVLLLAGGYKNYRRFIRSQMTKGITFLVLGGLTGSGKTKWLAGLHEKGEQVLDLEKLACHRGSVFGGIGMAEQPTNEQFENDLYAQLTLFNHERSVWVEDESRQIGRVFLPDPMYEAITNETVIKIKVDEHLRIDVLMEAYGSANPKELAEAIQRLSKRLGGALTQEILFELEHGHLDQVARLLLPYYDKTYLHGVDQRIRNEVVWLDFTGMDPDEIVQALVSFRKDYEKNMHHKQ